MVCTEAAILPGNSKAPARNNFAAGSGITLPADSPAEKARDIFAAAEALKLRSYFTYLGRELIDDHVPLNAIGIPTLDIIDFDFPWWHTADDTMDKISSQSLQTVGSVALYYLSEFALK
jgi:hypothetical protein